MENNEILDNPSYQQQPCEPQPVEAAACQPVNPQEAQPTPPPFTPPAESGPEAAAPSDAAEPVAPPVEEAGEPSGEAVPVAPPVEEAGEPVPAAPQLSDIELKIAELDAKFEEKILRDRRQSEMFDKLYKELETYRKDVYAKMLKPLVTGLVMLMGDLERSVERIESAEDAGERALKMLRDDLPEDLLDLLEENGVEPYTTEGDLFDPRSQKSMSVEPTGDPALDKHIARRLRRGYRWNGTTLRPETVVIYKYDPAVLPPNLKSSPQEGV